MVLTLTACSSSGPVASIEDRNQAAKGAKAGHAPGPAVPAAGVNANKGVEQTALPPESVSGAGTEGKPLEGSAETKPGRGGPAQGPREPVVQAQHLFDYDSNEVKDDYRPVIEAHAAYLIAHKDVKVTLQGNTEIAAAANTTWHSVNAGPRRCARRSLCWA